MSDLLSSNNEATVHVVEDGSMSEELPSNPLLIPEQSHRTLELREWITTVLNDAVPEGPLPEVCRTGAILCRLLNAVAAKCDMPPLVKKIHDSDLPFKAMENLSNFTAGCKTLGVPEGVCFNTLDFYQRKNDDTAGVFGAFEQTLWSLAAVLSKTKTYAGPKLPSSLQCGNQWKGGESVKNIPTMFTRRTTLSDSPSPTLLSPLLVQQPDKNLMGEGPELRPESIATVSESYEANLDSELSLQAGDLVFVLYLTDDSEMAMVQHENRSGLVPACALVAGAPKNLSGEEFILCRGSGGIDRILNLKAVAKYDKILEAKAQLWLDRLLGPAKMTERTFSSTTNSVIATNKFKFIESLHDGTRLCRLVNLFQPNCIASYDPSPSGKAKKFREMENISKFLGAARELGVRKEDLFDTVDLYEFKAVELVLQSLYALSRAALLNTDFPGPFVSNRCINSAEALHLCMDNNCSCFPSKSIIRLCTARQRAPIEQCRDSLTTSLSDSCDDEPVMHIIDTHAKTPRLPAGVAKWTGQENDALAFTEEDMGELWEAVFAGRLIGSGNFGSVAVATFRNRSVAVKMQPMPQPDEEWAQEIVDNLVCELSVLRSICHRSPYMVDFLGAGRVGNDIFSVMGLASRGDLRQVIEKSEVGERRMDWVSLARVLQDASYGLAYLHKHELLHRDFKTPNVLVQEDGSGLLCDFGFTIWADSPAKLETCAGTEEFMAPELCMGEDFHLPADVFSLGITICEVATRIRPGDNNFLYRSPRNMFAFEPELPHVHAVITEDFPLMLASIAEQCCQFEENKRPSASAAATSLHDLISEWSS